MKNVYLVIGHGNCGKSSLVRSITGRNRFGNSRIQSLNPLEAIEIRVRIRSAQEDGTGPETILNRILESKHDHYLLTLRVEDYNHQPKAIKYLEKMAIEPNINIAQIIVIGDKWFDQNEYNQIVPFSNRTNKFENSLKTPINVVSSYVKGIWGWV